MNRFFEIVRITKSSLHKAKAEREGLVSILKGRAVRYFKRISTGNPKRPWKYFYNQAQYEKFKRVKNAVQLNEKKSDEGKSFFKNDQIEEIESPNGKSAEAMFTFRSKQTGELAQVGYARTGTILLETIAGPGRQFGTWFVATGTTSESGSFSPRNYKIVEDAQRGKEAAVEILSSQEPYDIDNIDSKIKAVQDKLQSLRNNSDPAIKNLSDEEHSSLIEGARHELRSLIKEKSIKQKYHTLNDMEKAVFEGIHKVEAPSEIPVDNTGKMDFSWILDYVSKRLSA